VYYENSYDAIFCLYGVVGGVVVRASDLQPIGRRFKSRPLRFTYNPGQVVHTHVRCSHTHVPMFTKQYKLVPVQAGS